MYIIIVVIIPIIMVIYGLYDGIYAHTGWWLTYPSEKSYSGWWLKNHLEK
jgi:hypothetical protein